MFVSGGDVRGVFPPAVWHKSVLQLISPAEQPGMRTRWRGDGRCTFCFWKFNQHQSRGERCRERDGIMWCMPVQCVNKLLFIWTKTCLLVVTKRPQIVTSFWHEGIREFLFYNKNSSRSAPKISAFVSYYTMIGSVVVKALCYKPEGWGFETRWGEI
jgi:hypothetical protein